MPGIDGYEVCRQIRANEAFRTVKIIMVSSRSELKERLNGYASGADDYIGKPFQEEELLAKVRVFLRIRALENELQQLNNTLNEQVSLRTEQLLLAEKLAAIGRYSAGIVHNLNTPLQVIMGSAELLAIKHPDNPNIMRLRKAAAQMKKIISTIISTGYREGGTDYTEVDLNEVIRDQIELLKSNTFFKHKIRTEMILSSLPAYRGIYAHFSQSFGNLIKNAADAMYSSEQKFLSITTSVKDGIILIRISDTGHGISKERMAKIFNPFFTTKPLTASDERPTGTGLGLASAKEMIEAYGGEISVESQLGKGSVFTVILPIMNRKDAGRIGEW
jgi:signal transduction histidine kinase